MNDQQNELSIDLVNLIGHLLIKWKGIICVSVLFAVVGGLIGLTRIETVNNSNSNNAGSVVEDAKSQLTEKQITEAEEYYSLLIACDKAIDEQRVYNEESYIMSLDPKLAVGYDMQYLIETDIENILSVLNVSLLTEEDYIELSKLLGSNIGKRGLDDIISVKAQTLGLDDNLNTEYMHQGASGNSYKLVLSLTIIAPDRDSCDGIIKLVNSAVERKINLIKEQGAICKCKQVFMGYDVNIQDYINVSQQNVLNMMGSLLTNRSNYINNVIAKLDAKEKAYIDTLLGNVSNETEIGTKNEGVSLRSGLRYLLIGLLTGFILSIIWYTFKYVHGGKIHTTEDLTELFGIPVYRVLSKGYLSNNTAEMDFVKKLGYKLTGADEGSEASLEMLLNELNNKVGSIEAGKTYIATDRESIVAMDFAQRISEQSSEKALYIVGGLEPNADDIKQLLGSDHVILLPAIDVTRGKIIKDFMDICRRNDKVIIGAVPVREGRQ